MRFAKGFRLKIFIIECLLLTVSGEFCLPNPCKNEGRCVHTFGDIKFKCVCIHGFKGSTCEENIDDCKHKPCQNGGQCIDQHNSRYVCKCSNGYIGDHCQYRNPCKQSNPCLNGGQCESTQTGKVFCKCQKTFIGEICENKTFYCPKDETVSREMCSKKGQCQTKANGELFCKCDEGYSGNRCESISNSVQMGCLEGYCHNNGKCINLSSGLPHCTCSSEFTGKQCENRMSSSNNHYKIKTKAADSVRLTTKKNNPEQSKNPLENGCDSKCHQLKRNGVCDRQCNTQICNFDGGDCDPWRKCRGSRVSHCRNVFSNGQCNPECNSVDCLFDGDDCLKSTCRQKSCSKVYQDNICNEECNNPQCGFDGGDCQTKNANSFFHSSGLGQCSSPTNVYELDLVLITSIKEFQIKKLEFLQKLSSSLRMVVKISNLSEITFNNTKAIRIRLHVNHTQCVLYGGQCFSSLDQISNFLTAGIQSGSPMALPFRVAKIITRVIPIFKKKSTSSPYIIVLGAMGFILIITVTLVGVLLRDKWGKLRTKIKTAGIWTPSDSYSTSTSSINSGHKLSWPNFPQMKDFKKEYQNPNKFAYNDNNFKFEPPRNLLNDNDNEKTNAVSIRKRKYEVIHRNDKAATFQLISDALESADGVHPIDSSSIDICEIIADKTIGKCEEKYQNSSLEGLGDYVNENGESLMHIAARMNCGPNVIKQLNLISPPMLQSLDEWGRTPLATSISADAVESTEQLIILEKQLRKESKQNKSRIGIGGISSGASCEYLVKKTTALIESVKLDSKEIINLLLDEGSPVNVLDTHGRSIVHWAAMFNNIIVLERLSHMKIFQKLADLKDHEDKSPLYLAANEGSHESVKFLLEYFNKTGIKIDPNCPCPKMIAEEKGFQEIQDIIYESLRKITFSEKNGKRVKLKDPKTRKKIPSFENPARDLCIIDEYKELSANSIENFQSSPLGNESIDSCLLELYSITDSSLQNAQELYHNEKNVFPSFKPTEYGYQGYQSNTSSSDMSPPLLNLNNLQFQNGFNHITYSDPMDPSYSNTIFMSPQSFIAQPDLGVNAMNKNKMLDFPAEFYNSHQSPKLMDYKNRSHNLSNFPPLNCPL